VARAGDKMPSEKLRVVARPATHFKNSTQGIKMEPDDIKKISEFMGDEGLPSVDFMIESYKEMLRLLQRLQGELKKLDNKGYLE